MIQEFRKVLLFGCFYFLSFYTLIVFYEKSQDPELSAKREVVFKNFLFASFLLLTASACLGPRQLGQNNVIDNVLDNVLDNVPGAWLAVIRRN